MVVVADELWTLVLGRPQIDPDALAAAIVRAVVRGDLDFRTRLLIRDALDALRRRWGAPRVEAWVSAQACSVELRRLIDSDMGPAGFPSLGERLMESTKQEMVQQFLRELGSRLAQPAKVTIGGSIALILAGALSRHTEDIDIVDEVPGEIRREHDLLRELSQRYGLQLTHFQSHYLPGGWESRVRSIGAFGRLRVFIVDTYDIFLGKLFSARDKDRDDLRMLWPAMDQERLAELLRSAAGTMLGEALLRRNAEQNWYVLSGEKLPV
jgi:hypothetical protein